MNRTFYDKYIDKKCHLLIVTNIETFNLFNEIYRNFMDQPIKICTFDLEFNNSNSVGRSIALMQFGLHINKDLFIIIINPYITTSSKSYIIDMLSDQTVIKIGHGTDSLDLPLLKELLGPEKTGNLVSRLYDTRFICEYVNTLSGSTLCNLYAVYKEYDAVDDKQIKYLEKTEKRLGNFWTQTIDIHNMSDELVEYAMYDVVYLCKLLKNMKIKIEQLDLSYNMIVHLTRMMFMIKLNLLEFEDTNIYNTYYFSNVPIRTHFENNIERFKQYVNIDTRMILENNILKKKLLPLLQNVFYKFVCDKQKINKTKKIFVNQDDKNLLSIILGNTKNKLNDFPAILDLINMYEEYLNIQ